MTVSSPIRKMKGFVLITCLFFLQQFTSLLAAPPIESCPHDSVLIEDTCKCNYSLCSKPLCLYDLVISSNGTDTPGSCCPTYSCEGCSNSTLIDGQCPCAPDAILSPAGECRCTDPHKSLVEGECVCDPDLCELPQLCDANHVPVTEREGCCPKTVCIQCPHDSFATNNRHEEFEDKCVCYPCTKECGPGEKVVVIRHGNGFPGNCCDLYSCEKEDKKDNVVSFTKDEEFFGSCLKEGSVYKHNESWMLDSCTNCTCLNGETKCIAHTCEVSQGFIDKPDCQPLNCSKNCTDGYKVNKRGCKICKCNSSYKYDDILHKYNITKNELREIIEDYFARKRSGGASTAEPGVRSTGRSDSDDERFTTPVAELDDSSQLVTWIVPTIILAILVGMLVVCGIRHWCCLKKGRKETKTARNTTYERIKFTKPSMFNNNYIGNNNKDEKNTKGTV